MTSLGSRLAEQATLREEAKKAAELANKVREEELASRKLREKLSHLDNLFEELKQNVETAVSKNIPTKTFKVKPSIFDNGMFDEIQLCVESSDRFLTAINAMSQDHLKIYGNLFASFHAWLVANNLDCKIGSGWDNSGENFRYTIRIIP